MPRYGRSYKRRGVGSVMRKARKYRSRGLASFGNRMGRYLSNKIKNPVHWFRKQVDLGLIYETGAAQHKAYQFTFNQLSEYVELQELYDQYLIKKVILTYEPQYDSAGYGQPSQKWMRVVHDYDDVVPLSAEVDYLEYQNCKSRVATSHRSIKTVLYPRVLKPSLQVGGAAVYSGAKPGWISTDFLTVAHLGIKIYIPGNILPVGATLYKCRATFVVGFKNSR